MVFLGDLTGDLAKDLPADAVVVITLCGQSNIWGTNSFLSTQETPPQYGDPRNENPMPGVWAWDKLKRINAHEHNSTDPYRDDAAHRWRQMTVGWGAGGAAYPWEEIPADPTISSLLQLGHRIRMATQRDVFFVHMAKGGTALFNVGGTTQNWNIAESGDESLFELWRDHYWNDAMTYLVDNILGGDATRVHLAGLVWFQGAGDMNVEARALAYEANLKDLLDVTAGSQAGFRKVINPADEDAVPTVIIRSEKYYDSVTGAPTLNHTYVDTIRTAQETVQALIPNSALVSSDEWARETADGGLPGEGEHFIAEGQNAMGNAIAGALLGLTWLQEPSY